RTWASRRVAVREGEATGGSSDAMSVIWRTWSLSWSRRNVHSLHGERNPPPSWHLLPSVPGGDGRHHPRRRAGTRVPTPAAARRDGRLPARLQGQLEVRVAQRPQAPRDRKSVA